MPALRTSLALTALSLTLAACARPRVYVPTTGPGRPSASPSQDTWIVATEQDPRGTDALASLTRTSVAFLDDGTFVLLAPDGSPAFASITRDGALRSQTPHAIPAAQCALQPSGNAVLRVCAGATDGDAHAWWIDRSHVVALPEPVSSRVLSDSTGDSVAFDGRCNPSESDDGTTFCWLTRDQPTWREWSAPNRASLLAIRGEFALLTEPGDLRATLSHFGINTARRTVIEQTDPTLEVDAAGFTPTGDVVILSHRTSRNGAIESFACVAALGYPCTARPLHIRATDLAFADARQGIAVGAHANELSITRDGGASWSPILPSGHPSPESVELPAPTTVRNGRRMRIRVTSTAVRCNTHACVSGRLVHRWPED